jgi:hypothetical protein
MAVEEAVDHKIHAPAGVKTINLRPGHPSVPRDMPAGTLAPQIEPLLAVNQVYPFVIDAQAFAPHSRSLEVWRLGSGGNWIGPKQRVLVIDSYRT